MHKCNIVFSASDIVSRECVLKESVIMLCVLKERVIMLCIVSGRVSVLYVLSERGSIPCIVSLVPLARPSGFAICIPSAPCTRALGTQSKFFVMLILILQHNKSVKNSKYQDKDQLSKHFNQVLRTFIQKR